MSAEALRWLAARTPAPPEPLQQRLTEAIAAGPSAAGVPALLGEAALARLAAALELGEDRAAAYELLTADALLTYALEAAAEQGLSSVEALVEAYGPARIAPLIADGA